MRKRRFLALILALAMTVTFIPLPSVEIKAEETVISVEEAIAFDSVILAENAMSNSGQDPAQGVDGPVEWAFDDENHWWHSRWTGTRPEGEASNGKPTTNNPIWIQTGFDREWYVSSIEYTGRDSGDGIIHNYQVLVANLEEPTDTPAEGDFELVKEGVLQAVNTVQTIEFDYVTAATHVRIVVTDAYDVTDGGQGDGHVAEKKISILGYDEDPNAVEPVPESDIKDH